MKIVAGVCCIIVSTNTFSMDPDKVQRQLTQHEVNMNFLKRELLQISQGFEKRLDGQSIHNKNFRMNPVLFTQERMDDISTMPDLNNIKDCYPSSYPPSAQCAAVFLQ